MTEDYTPTGAPESEVEGQIEPPVALLTPELFGPLVDHGKRFRKKGTIKGFIFQNRTDIQLPDGSTYQMEPGDGLFELWPGDYLPVTKQDIEGNLVEVKRRKGKADVPPVA